MTDQKEYLKAFNNYFPQSDRESGCIKKIKEDLEKIKKMTDIEEKYQKANFVWIRHHDDEAYASSHYSNGNLRGLGISHSDTIEKYRRLIKELWNLKVKLGEELKKI